MLKKRALVNAFLVVFVLSILLLILSNIGLLNGFSSIISKITTPVQKSVYSTFGLILQKGSDDDFKKLQEENLLLTKKLIDQEKLKEDNQALRDQFQTASPKSTELLPCKVISFPSFIPNVSIPETLIIDKGTSDSLKIGQAVIFKDNLVGKVAKTLSNKSLVYLVTHPSLNFTAEILNSNTTGVIKGLGGGEMVLDNVLLSDNLEKDEIVLTKGDLTMENVNFPQGLIVGKITAIDKNPSALFQTAGVKSLIDLSNLTTVFVILEK